jgi:hypothetical protein
MRKGMFLAAAAVLVIEASRDGAYFTETAFAEPDPRVILSLRASSLKRKAPRTVTGDIGKCVPTFHMDQPMTPELVKQVEQGNACLDKFEAEIKKLEAEAKKKEAEEKKSKTH